MIGCKTFSTAKDYTNANVLYKYIPNSDAKIVYGIYSFGSKVKASGVLGDISDFDFNCNISCGQRCICGRRIR